MVVENRTSLPDEQGHFGDFGGKFVPETLMAALEELETAYVAVREDPDFQAKLGHLLRSYVGRPTPVYFAENLTRHCGGAKIYFKLGRLGPHRRPQDKQRFGPSPLGPKHGQKTDHRRDRRGPARRRLRHPPAPCWAWTASSTWAPRTFKGSP